MLKLFFNLIFQFVFNLEMVYPTEMKGVAIGLHAAKFTNQQIVDKIKTMYEQCEPDRKMPNLATVKKWKKEFLTKGHRIKSIKKLRVPKHGGGAPKKMTPDMTYDFLCPMFKRMLI